MTIAGIDPGAKGGIAVIDNLGLAFAQPLPLHESPHNVKLLDFHAIGAIIPPGTPVFVERVWARLRDGSKQAFAFGGNYHMVLMALDAHGYEVCLVTPQKWQARMFTKSLQSVELPFPTAKGIKPSKVMGLKYCVNRWPDVRLVPPRCKVAHDGMSDALCIAAYGDQLKGQA